ncbi:MAG TPA: methyltransferase [Vicinamibacteria bacterium]|nr:methyltransferase [Vicinamibacteria bacterium]
MHPPPRPLAEAARQALADALGEHGYEQDACARRLGLTTPERLVQRVQAWRVVGARAQHPPRTGQDATPLDLLIALLLFGEAVARERITAVLGGAGGDALLESGLARLEGDRVAGNVMLFPCHGLYLATDRLDADRAQNPVMPLFPESYDLGRIAVRAPVEWSLDVCTGSGVHALLAARHAREAMGIDVSERALAFSRFNAWLNGIGNVTWLRGDVYAPLPQGVRYGLITANPPYNPELDSAAGDDYHSGGESGEEILERLVAGLPPLLEPGGYAQIITLLIHRQGDDLDARLRRWLDSPDFDVLLLCKPVDYRPLVLKGGPLSPADQALHESWKRQRITRFEFGVINVRRAPAAREGRLARGPSYESPEAGDVPARFTEAFK